MQIGFGGGILTGTRNDIANGTPIRFGIMQDIDLSFDGEIKQLWGQGQFAIDSRRGKTKIEGKAKFAQISGLIFANLMFGTALSTGQTIPAYNEAQTTSAAVSGATSAATAAASAVLTFTSVPTGVIVGMPVVDTTHPTVIPAGTYVLSKTATTVTMSAACTGAGVTSGDTITFGSSLTVTNSGTYAGDLGVFYANTGNPLTFVVGAPVQGQYTESAGVYVFSAADAATPMLVNYLWLSSMTGYTIAPGNPLMGITPKFQANFQQQVDSNYLNLILYACVASKLTLPTKLDDYIIQEMDFMAFANAAGQTFSLSLSGE